MGCDIHYVIERRRQTPKKRPHQSPRYAPLGGWIGVFTTSVFGHGFHEGYRAPPLKSRDYAFFSELANVRGESKDAVKPRGLPVDPSALTIDSFDEWQLDAHSVSYATLREFYDAWRRANPGSERIRDEFWAADAFGLFELEDVGSVDHPYEYRVVFWFDN